jgi:hypothetical protein
MSAVAAASASDALGSKKRKQDDISIPSLVGSGAVSSATSLSNGNGGTTRTTHAPPNKMFWQWTVDEIGEWVRGLSALFPPAPTAPSSKAGTTKPSEAGEYNLAARVAQKHASILKSHAKQEATI